MRNLTDLMYLHPVARKKFSKFINALEKRGWTVYITSGFRSYDKQTMLYRDNPKNAAPMTSFHNYGLALDFNFQKGKVFLKKATPKAIWEQSGIPSLAASYGFRWGGNFKGYYDPVHFDMSPEYSMDSLRKIVWRDFGIYPGIASDVNRQRAYAAGLPGNLNLPVSKRTIKKMVLVALLSGALVWKLAS